MPDTSANSWRAWIEGRASLLLASFVALYLIAGALAIAQTGVTVDEPNHFTRGLAIWQTGDTRLSFAHPPVANVLSATPAAVALDLADVSQTSAWPEADPGRVGMEVAQRDYASFRRGIMLGRGISLLWGAALLISLFAFARRHLDATVALSAVALLAFNPTFIAHNALITTDGPITAATFWLMTAAYDHGRAPDRWTALRAGLSVALVPIVKLSGPLLCVIAVVVFVIARVTAPSDAPGVPQGRGRRLGGALAQSALAAMIAIASINVAYVGDRTLMRMDEIRASAEPTHPLSTRAKGELVARDGTLTKLPDGLRLPFPYTYVYGLSVVKAQAKQTSSGWFLGHKRNRRHPAYVPLVLLGKTPLPVWVLLGVGLAQMVRRRIVPTTAVMSLGVAFVYLLLASRSNAMLGVRYLLPAFPFIALAAAHAVEASLAPKRPPWAVSGLSALALATVLCVPVAAGRDIGWFNLLVGGRAGGTRMVMVGEDWGQDLARLATTVESLDAQPLLYEQYHRYGPVELEHFGAEFRTIKCKEDVGDDAVWVALHRAREVRYDPKCYPWKPRVVETHLIADHISLYRLAPTPRS